jgi:UTP-glucose-1-phosphate uridylyltransferase
VLDEPRHDAGDKLGFLTATIAFAARRPDLGPALMSWLDEHGGALRATADRAGDAPRDGA